MGKLRTPRGRPALSTIQKRRGRELGKSLKYLLELCSISVADATREMRSFPGDQWLYKVLAGEFGHPNTDHLEELAKVLSRRDEIETVAPNKDDFLLWAGILIKIRYNLMGRIKKKTKSKRGETNPEWPNRVGYAPLNEVIFLERSLFTYRKLLSYEDLILDVEAICAQIETSDSVDVKILSDLKILEFFAVNHLNHHPILEEDDDVHLGIEVVPVDGAHYHSKDSIFEGQSGSRLWQPQIVDGSFFLEFLKTCFFEGIKVRDAQQWYTLFSLLTLISEYISAKSWNLTFRWRFLIEPDRLSLFENLQEICSFEPLSPLFLPRNSPKLLGLWKTWLSGNYEQFEALARKSNLARLPDD